MASEQTASAAADESLLPSQGLRATSLWLLACLLVFLWWAVTYGGLVERMAEWQFARFGRYFPSLTVGAVVLVLALPIAALVGWQRRRQRQKGDRAVPAILPAMLMERAIRSAERTRLFFAVLAIVAALVAVGVFVSMLWLPPDSGPVRTISGTEGSVQPEGAAAYAQPYRLGPVARIVENVGPVKRVMYVAPVYLAGQHDGGSFLTTVYPAPEPPLRFIPITSGVLVERGLPRELVKLYQAASVPVPTRSYLLMRDAAAVRWRSLVLGIQIALLALVAGIMSLLYRGQGRRLRRVLGDAEPLTTA